MYQRILLPTDGAPGMQGVATLGLELAVAFDAAVHAIAVTDTRVEPDGMSDQDRTAWRAAARAEGEAAVGAIQDRADELGLDATTAVREGTPHREILQYSTAHDIELAVMGMYSGQETYPPQLGSTTERIITFGDVPVLATPPAEGIDLRGPERTRYERVGLATDGSQAAARATEQAMAFATHHEAAVDGVHVIDAVVYEETIQAEVTEAAEQEGADALSAVTAAGEDRGVPVSTHLLRGDPSSELLEFSDAEALDLLVMGARGHTTMASDLLGATTARVIRRSEIPVLVAN